MWSLIFVTVFIIPVAFSYAIPEQIERCHLKDANLDNCLKIAIGKALRSIGTTGIPSINLPPIEPIEIAKTQIAAGSSAVNLVQNYEDVKFYGYVDAQVEEAHLDMDKKELTFTTYQPNLIQKAKYNINGKILTMPMYGTGDSTITLLGVKIIHKINFEEEIRKSKKYFKLTSYVVRIAVKDAQFDFQNLFNGNKQLADTILKVLNENGALLVEDVKEGIQLIQGEVYRNIAAIFFHNIPVDEIFLQ